MKAIDELSGLPNFGSVRVNGVEDTGLTETLVCVSRARLDAICVEIERELEEEYVALPKDANGEPIHVGDEMYSAIDGDTWHGTVSHMLLQDEGWTLGDIGYFADALSHYKPPSACD